MVYTDYTSFAAERPQELAQAIAKGIPPALRGMMWQHMYAVLALLFRTKLTDLQGGIQRSRSRGHISQTAEGDNNP
jgi:hypothetical protein